MRYLIAILVMMTVLLASISCSQAEEGTIPGNGDLQPITQAQPASTEPEAAPTGGEPASTEPEAASTEKTSVQSRSASTEPEAGTRDPEGRRSRATKVTEKPSRKPAVKLARKSYQAKCGQKRREAGETPGRP